MASRQATSMSLVKRIERLAPLGWTVERRGDGYMAKNGRGQQHGIHLTYSDRNSLQACIREMDAQMGLADDEMKLKGNKLRERAEVIAADRQRAERKTLTLQARDTHLVAKAAGPYMVEPEPCDLAWLTAEHPRPWFKWMYVTAKAARIILDDHNSDNRAFSQTAADRYAAIMVSDQWHLTHQGAAFDTRGILQDAQHRMAAVSQVGEQLDDPDYQVPFAVFVGMPQENFKAIDEGRLRTATQMLKKDGRGNPTHLPTIVRTVAAFNSEAPRAAAKHIKIANAQLFAILDADREEYDEAAAFGGRHYRKTGVTPGALGAAYYLIRQANGHDNPYVDAFFEGFARNRKHNTNLVLPEDDPRAVLRTKFEYNSPKPIEAVFWFIHTWNNLVKGHHPRYLKANDDTPPPRILICLPGEGITPRALAGEIIKGAMPK